MKRKLLSALLVTSMMLTMAPPAFATDLTPVPPTNENAPADGEGTPNDATTTEVSDAAGLAAAVQTENAQITLTDNITLNTALTIDKPVTIDGQGHTITGAVNLQNGTLQNMTIASNTNKILTIGSGEENTIRMENVTLKYSVTERDAGSAVSVSGNKADIVIHGCHFINEPQNDGQTINALQWSYGLYINKQADEGSITFTNNEFNGAFRTMLPNISGNVSIKDNVFTNTVYSVANGPTSGSQGEATCITTADKSTNDQFIITDNIFNNAGAFYFQQTEKAKVHNNTFNFDTFEYYIQARDGAAHPLDLTDNTFVMGSNNLVIIDTTAAPIKLPVGQRAVSYWPWAETPNNIKPADYSTYGYAYNADGTMSFYPGSEGALLAFMAPASGNIGVQDGDTVTLTDHISLDGTGKGNNEGLLTLDKDITFDGNGKTLSARNVTVNEGKGPSMVNIVDGAKGNAIPLPMPEAIVTKDADKAPTVTVDLPSDQRAKVEVPVKDVTAGTVAILVKEDGTEEIIKTTIQSENGVIVTLADGDTIKLVDNSKDFADVADSFWAAETIDFATSRGLFGGTSDTTFSPNMAMTRAMIVTVLARLDGADLSGGDVWYEKGREWAMENGISDGNNMMDSLTREQLVTMLWRYADKPNSTHSLSDYKDAAAVSDFAKDAFAWAVEEGIISGTTVDTLSPQGTATRAQVAAILTRFCTNMAE